jgi:hypothetical protein
MKTFTRNGLLVVFDWAQTLFSLWWALHCLRSGEDFAAALMLTYAAWVLTTRPGSLTYLRRRFEKEDEW